MHINSIKRTEFFFILKEGVGFSSENEVKILHKDSRKWGIQRNFQELLNQEIFPLHESRSCRKIKVQEFEK